MVPEYYLLGQIDAATTLLIPKKQQDPHQHPKKQKNQKSRGNPKSYSKGSLSCIEENEEEEEEEEGDGEEEEEEEDSGRRRRGKRSGFSVSGCGFFRSICFGIRRSHK